MVWNKYTHTVSPRTQEVFGSGREEERRHPRGTGLGDQGLSSLPRLSGRYWWDSADVLERFFLSTVWYPFNWEGNKSKGLRGVENNKNGKKCLFAFIFAYLILAIRPHTWIKAEIAHASHRVGWLNQKVLIGEWQENGCIGRLWIFPLL